MRLSSAGECPGHGNDRVVERESALSSRAQGLTADPAHSPEKPVAEAEQDRAAHLAVNRDVIVGYDPGQ
jgi:hypothetical protein